MQYAKATLVNLTVVVIVTVGIAVGCPSAVTAQESVQSSKSNVEKTKSEVLKLLESQSAAWNEGDLDSFMNTYWKSPALTFSSGGNTTRGWQATLDRYKTSYDSPEKMGTLTFDELDFQLLSPEVALVLGQWHLKRSEDAPRGNFSLVMKRIDDNWKIVHDHSSTLEPDTDKSDDH